MPQVSGVAKRFLPQKPTCAFSSLDTASASLYGPPLHIAQVGNKAHVCGPYHVIEASHSRKLLSPCESSSCASFANSIWRHAVNYRRVFLLVALWLAAALVQSARRVAAGDEWQPITQEELRMTIEPKAPGAHAIILYRQIDRDDSNSRTPHEFNYVRVKIFTEEGRKNANVEIPFVKENESIHSIKARTIRPDGTIVNFDGKVYEKEIVKARGFKFLAKTFTLPDVQPGSIIEYHYSTDFHEYRIFDAHWTLSEELFTKRGKYSLKPYAQFALRWSWPNGLPDGTPPPAKQGDIIRMDSENIPAFLIEDDMPPEDTMKFKVDFNYTDGNLETDPEKFWKKRGKKLNDEVEGFAGKRKAMEEAVAQIVSPSDTPEAKLQKIYARVPQRRNTSFERAK